MRRITAGALLLAWASIAPAADLELKGHRIGEPKSALGREWRCTKPQGPVGEDLCISFGGTLAGAPMQSLSLVYFGGQVSAIFASFDQKHFAQVHAALVEKYGSPTESQVAQVQTRMGATFDNRTSAWRSSAGTLIAVERLGKIDDSSITIEAPDYQAKVEALKAGRASRGADDL